MFNSTCMSKCNGIGWPKKPADLLKTGNVESSVVLFVVKLVFEFGSVECGQFFLGENPNAI